ncbi:MAG: hypothetical protein ABJD68_15575, partial [Nakamurella sp.]
DCPTARWLSGVGAAEYRCRSGFVPVERGLEIPTISERAEMSIWSIPIRIAHDGRHIAAPICVHTHGRN